MLQGEVHALMAQIEFFNEQFHSSEMQSNLKSFHALMRASKNRCQLMLLKFADADLVWIKQDLHSPNQEWLVGAYGLSLTAACHIPLHVLSEGLSEELLNYWNIH